MKINLKKLFDSEVDLNDKMEAVILKAIKSGAQEDASYIQFRQAIAALKDLDMDESTSIKSAYATLSTTGVTKSSLLESLRKISLVVDTEKEKFAIALKNQILNQIEKPKLNEGKFDDMIAKKKEQINKLKEEIKLIEQKKASLDDDIAAAEVKINKTRDEFKQVYEHFAKSIDNDKILIDTLITDN